MPADLPQIHALFNRVVTESDVLTVKEPLSRDAMRRHLSRQCDVRVCDDGGIVFGAAWLRPNQLGKCAHIACPTVIVDSHSRDRDLGRRLLSDLAERAQLLQFRALHNSSVVVENTNLRQLYEDAEYQLLGTVPAGYQTRDGRFLDTCIYHRQLH